MKLGLLMNILFLAGRGATQGTSCLDVALTEIPSCAQSCFLQNAPSIGCDGTDFTCQCQKEATLYAAVEPCVASGCPEPSFQAVIDGASSVCNCATAIHGGLVAENSFGSLTVAPTVIASGSAVSSVIGTVTGTVIENPTGTSAPSAPASTTSSRSSARNYRSDLECGFPRIVLVVVLIFSTCLS
ncbi:uncharacterized protein F4822DRAFT_99880 [Hypoxylon trugodes]|uniref:uncharacterized protein n=1 Tax=Hypoxylon trugodes TaxID=326681 RepID=UPI00219ABC89|nr:uncharacterized protein F4822DRAFT_99880 [Hypoxylon trugodes]KAI1382872.1 hypothetical protein F4822DRAFT_99880 [Hypoxylon trugodes]